jgi:hypothetical protein
VTWLRSWRGERQWLLLKPLGQGPRTRLLPPCPAELLAALSRLQWATEDVWQRGRARLGALLVVAWLSVLRGLPLAAVRPALKNCV